MRRAAVASPRRGSASATLPASTVRSGSISAPSRRPRSPCRSSPRSRRPCAPTGSRRARRHERDAMNFGEAPVGAAAGAILVHSIRAGGRTFKKGRVLTEEDTAALAAAGVNAVVVARLEPGELGEDEAASLLARAVAGEHLAVADAFTGRANLHAERRGLVVLDRERLDAFNLVDEAVTLATLPPFAIVEPKQMVATIKIVPFAVPRAIVERCAAIAGGDGALLRLAPFRPLDVALIQTRLPGLKETILDKTVEVTRARLASLGSTLRSEARCAHTVSELAAAIAQAAPARPDLLLIAGASAIVDRRDVIPAALVASGGEIRHFGMPVDPGNLILLGRLHDKPVLGLPGCARSPKENGFDWVLQRLAAGLEVAPADIMRMGAGGLLAEIPSRPLPRAAAAPEKPPAAAPGPPRIAALILAAGQSRRMGEVNKLLIEIEGKPMVRRVAETVLASRAAPVFAVLGHERDRCARRSAACGCAASTIPITPRAYRARCGAASRRCRPISTARSSASATCRSSMPPPSTG